MRNGASARVATSAWNPVFSKTGEVNAIYPGSNFTWGEATKDCTRPCSNLIINGKLRITALQVEQKIIQTSKYLDQVREKLGGRPLYVTSWYRPQSVNARVGGSKYSRHQYGEAVDIRSDYLQPSEIYRLLETEHCTGGLHHYYSFVHIDWRGNKARW